MEFSNLRPKTVAIITGALIGVFIAGFLIGYLPQRRTIESLQEQIAGMEQQSAALQQSLKLAELRGAAGLMSYRANRENYGEAAKLSTGFFNGVREMIDEVENEAARRNLQSILERRDEVTAALAQADPSVKDALATIYADFFQLRKSG
jgi:hypothetical protein